MKMTTGLVSKALFLAVTAFTLSPRAQAQLSVAPGYSVSTYYTHNTSDDIVSFDWDFSSNLYYLTNNDAVWKTNGGAPTNIYTAPSVPNDTYFPGASVTTVGNYVYFNDSDFNGEYIYAYGPLLGSPSVSQVSSASNYSLLGHSGALFLTGLDSNFNNNIYYSTLNANGALSATPVSLGSPGGSSGPLAFDSAGDLYYAAGYNDGSIYKWSAAEVAAAIADPTDHPLAAPGHLWADYTSQFSGYGSTSMLVAPDGDLLVTATEFDSTSYLLDFGANANGSYNGTDTTVLTDGGLLGEIRENDDNVYVAADNEIVQIVPEPATVSLAGLGALALLIRRRRKA